MGPTSKFDKFVRKAAARWERIITADHRDIPAVTGQANFDWFAGFFKGAPPVNVPIDDILIGYKIEKIDGASGLIARAGPTRAENNPSFARVQAGVMQFDEDDFVNLSDNDIEVIVTHEMVSKACVPIVIGFDGCTQ